jgi:hypothetical protein
VAAADLNYDMRSDLVVAGESGISIFRQDEQGGFHRRHERGEDPGGSWSRSTVSGRPMSTPMAIWT